MQLTNDTYITKNDIPKSEEITLNDPGQLLVVGNRLFRSNAFRIFCICGIASVVVDLDHFTPWHRSAHIPAVFIAFVTFVVLCGVYGYLISRSH